MDLSFVDLNYFNNLAKTKNMTQSARDMGVTQPSLSLAIKRMEESLGVTLFVRSKKGVELTRAGKELFIKSGKLIDMWNETKSITKSSHNDVKGHIRFGVHPSVGIFTLKFFLPKFLKHFPEVTFDLVHNHSREINQNIIDLNLDMGIVVNPKEHPDLIISNIFSDEVCLWEGKKSNPDVLICDASLVQSQELLKKLKRSKLDFKRTIRCSSLENIVSLVESGVGVGIIPERVVKESKYKLSKVHKTPIFKDQFCLVYRVEQKQVKLISELVNHIKLAFK